MGLNPARPTRRLLIPLALCGISLLAAIHLAPPPARADTASDGKITAEEVKAFAAAVNLRSKDLPEAEVGSNVLVSRLVDDRRLASCAHAPRPARPARVESDAFELPNEAFYSAVEARPDPTENAEWLDLLNSKRGFSCLRQIIVGDLKRFKLDDVRISKPSVSHLALKPHGDARVCALRLRYVLDLGDEGEFPVNVMAISVLPKNIAFELVATKLGQPPSRAKVQRPLVLLYTRAVAADP